MHSSTSSFRTLPQGWFSLIAGGLLALALLVGWELFWRKRGYVPTITDTETLWCRERTQVKNDSVVIVGSSRLQAGLDPALLSRALDGRDVRQLAINGANPTPTLLDLSNDDSFAGVVVLEYMPLRLFTADAGSVGRAQAFVHACRSSTLVAEIDSAMSRVLQKRFVFMSSELHPITIVSYARRHRALPRNSYSHLREDRFLALTFSAEVTDGGEEQSRLWEVDTSPNALDERLGVMAAAVGRIQARGGHVILYRPPVTKGILADEEAHFPVATWGSRAATTLHVPFIDFAAVPELANTKSPDGGHLAAADVPRVTTVVARELQRILQR